MIPGTSYGKVAAHKIPTKTGMYQVRSKGSLVIVGTGINTFAHCTSEAKAHIEQAEKLIVHVPDPLGMSWLHEIQPNLIDLQACYRETSNRSEAYELMVTTITDTVLQGFRTVAVFYGHPGVFVSPSHEAIRRIRKAGLDARMLPGISAEDCLHADIGIDPAQWGCCQHEATRFLFQSVTVNTSASLILWQVGTVGDHTLRETRPAVGGLEALKQKLLRYYPADHKIAVYEAPSLPAFSPRIDWLTIGELASARVSPISTLYIPAYTKAEPDWLALSGLGLTVEQALYRN